jgi:solute carrier family 13 (sodium-dependent dicarboxylate transporter), member 2/3/5
MLLFIGTMAVAVMFDKTGLHKRIAIKTLLIVGENPVKILFGFMITTWFCSMWINNTATTVRH